MTADDVPDGAPDVGAGVASADPADPADPDDPATEAATDLPEPGDAPSGGSDGGTAGLAPRPGRVLVPARPVIPALDGDAMRAARAWVADDPRAGALADVRVWAAGVQGTCPPRAFARPAVLVAAGRHDAARYVGVDADAVADRIAALQGGEDGLTLQILDAGTVRPSAGRIDREDGLTLDEVERAFALGAAEVDRQVDAGVDLLLVGDVDADDGCAVATLASLLTGREPVSCVRSDPDPGRWGRTVEIVRDARRRGRSRTGHALPLLATVGGADLAMLTGVLVQAAVRRTAVLLDGPAATVCGLVAEVHADGCSIWWTAASRSRDPAHIQALAMLELEPLLDLGLGHDGATDARLALPVLQRGALSG